MSLDFENEVILAIKGNKDSFAKVIKNLELSMYRVSKAILKSDNDCADAIQETILKSYKAITTLKHPEFFKTWIIRILINECKKINIQKNKVIPMEDVIIEKSFNNFEENLLIQDTLNLLENDLKDVVLLYYIEDLSVKDISDILNIPKGTVKSRLSRARTKLAIILRKDFKESDVYETEGI
ncbi:sigma-70 family RNA polymerase sigma factor [Clostridium frigidicarnis]|uniref:sigma-70 family RNA polymerase sigma factor n=1 Tax=Clostridium frigidicarnis TaxID=84698 RepID=UPI001A9A2C5B|nr:sigma-70 family RNA polymerase sigma factor [Clostridium frigidicarnis]